MKAPSLRRKRGFTLVELLVVISIIAVLASAGFGAATAAIQKAKKMSALAAATSIVSAVNNFYTDYGTLPTTAADDVQVETNTPAGVDLLKVLLGLEPSSTANPLNPKAINYLTVKQSKDKSLSGKPKDGLVRDSTGVLGLFDPWGGGYSILMDAKYDDNIVPAPKGGGGTTLYNIKVAVWSNGADGVDATGKATDDVKTW